MNDPMLPMLDTNNYDPALPGSIKADFVLKDLLPEDELQQTNAYELTLQEWWDKCNDGKIMAKLLTKKNRKTYGCCAEITKTVLPIFEEMYPNDNRPRLAIEAAENYARGEISEKELEIASSNASNAANVAYAVCADVEPFAMDQKIAIKVFQHKERAWSIACAAAYAARVDAYHTVDMLDAYYVVVNAAYANTNVNSVAAEIGRRPRSRNLSIVATKSLLNSANIIRKWFPDIQEVILERETKR